MFACLLLGADREGIAGYLGIGLSEIGCWIEKGGVSVFGFALQ